MDVINNKDGSVQDELLPITFVAVSPVVVKSEMLDDVSDEKYSHNFDTNKVVNVKGETDLIPESQIKREMKGETNACELGFTPNASITRAMENNSGPDILSFTPKTKPSNEIVMNTEGNVATEFAGCRQSNVNETCASLCTEDLLVKLEPICEIFESNLNEEKAFETGLNIKNIDDDRDAPLSLKQERNIFECVEDESSYQEDINQGFCVASTSSLNVEEMAEGLETSSTSYEEEDDNDDSAFDVTSGPSRIQMKGPTEEVNDLEKNSSKQSEKSVNSSQCVPVTATIECGRLHSSSQNSVSDSRTHPDEKVFQCTFCAASFALRCDLRTHLRIHERDKPFSCEVCGTTFARKSKLVEHERTHTGEKPFACEICRKAFTVKHNLKRHMQMHAGEKQLLCTICLASFDDKYQLKTHKRTHSGEKPFLCPFCPSSFGLKSNLNTHLRIHTGENRVHANEKPFSCHLCGIAFDRKAKLTEHMRTHTGEKPFSCEICKTAFSLKANLKRHMKVHSGV